MPTIKILDDLNTPVLDVATRPGSGLGKYLPDAVVKLMALRPIASLLRKRLSEAPTNPVALEFAVPDAVALGTGGDLAIDAGMRAAIGVHQPDELLFPADDLRDAISVPSGTAYVSAGLAPRVTAAAQGARGPLGFGFAAGASLGLRYFHPFDVTGSDPALTSALAQTLAHAVIPADADDLAALPPGSFVSVEGQGEVRFSGAVALASVTNPLATPGLPVVGSAAVGAGASLEVEAEWRASGALELRAGRVGPDRVRLSYYKRAGSDIAIEATAAVGVSATIRDSDAIRKLMTAISANPRADLEQLIDAGLSDEQIAAMQTAITTSIDRSLRLSAQMQLSSVRRGEALFAYDIDTAALTAADRTAVEAALGGELTPIDRAARTPDGPIRPVQTGLLHRRDQKVAWRINLFGIVNVQTIAQLLREGSLSYDELTGTLNAADRVTSGKIVVKTRPFESVPEKVRRLAFESTIVTAAYQASRLTPGLIALASASTYFEGRAKTNARDMREHFNALIGLGLADAAERDRRIGKEHDFGPSTFLLECRLDQNAASALFLNPAGDGPLPREHYERIGRDALLALIPPDDQERAHRRAAVEHDSSWQALRSAGPSAARAALARKFDAVQVEHIVSDYVVISWWADAMHDAGKALVAMRQFLGGRFAPELAADPEFDRRRRRLEQELADVVRDSRSQFGDPWGLLALDAASRRTAAAQGILVSPRLTAAYDQRKPASRDVPAAAAAAPRGQDPLAAPRAARRPLTADEREILRRHCVNLRLGQLSSDGEFQSSEADVSRLFTELLPAEVAAQRASGQKLRLMFYAHGGLTEERSGLDAVLKRLKFWRRNGVYPLSFVWETGLKETLSDILGALTGARDVAVRGFGEDVADAILEAAGREGGKRVWGQMKRSAELSVMAGGGAALVAQLTRDFWNAHHAAMEIHAAGHSAGAIFQANFVPALLALPVAAGTSPLQVKTLHLLAPACTTALFRTTLQGLVGTGVGALTMYTMNKSLEQADTAGPYRKSLLYLVSRAFETERHTPILGLEESLREEAPLLRFFGLAGRTKQSDLIFSKTAPDAPARSRSTSVTHGGFDDDAPTMSSLMRRVLDVPDATPIVDFFQEALEEAPRDVDPAAAAADAIARAVVTEPHDAAAPPIVSKPAESHGPALPIGGGRRRALCVGIDKYGHPFDLAGCVNDASNWANTLRLRDFDVTMLRDQEASRRAILDGFRSLTADARAGDVLVFQFAGHGTQVDDLDGDELDDGRDEAFCPADFAEGRLLIDDDIRAIVATLKPGVNLTCFIDCCHSGTITRALVPGGGRTTMLPGSKPRFIPYSRNLSGLHREFRKSEEARREAAPAVSPASLREVCFSACQPHEVALETAGAGQFTTRAMNVLASGADLTNAEFMERVVAAFGAAPPQHPFLDCAEDMKAQRLLGSLQVLATSQELGVRSQGVGTQ